MLSQISCVKQLMQEIILHIMGAIKVNVATIPLI